MKQENIQTVVKEIKQEFDRLKEATDYIEHSKEEVEEVLRFTKTSTNKLITKFEQIVDKIDKTFYAQTAEYKSEFNVFKQEIAVYKNEIKKTTENIFSNLEKPINHFNDLSIKSEQIVKKIDTINFPERLDKLENNVNSTIAAISLANKELNKQSHELIQEIENIKFTEKFAELKNEIQKTINELFKINQSFEASINDEFKKQNIKSEQLTNSISNIDIPTKIINIQQVINETTQKIISINEKTIVKTEKLTKEIDEIHISSRLDKLDATIAGINQSIQSVLQRIESVERNLKEGQQNKTNEIINRIDKSESYLQERTKIVENKVDKLEEQFIQTSAKNQANIFEQVEELKKQNKTIKIFLVITIVLVIICIGLKFIN